MIAHVGIYPCDRQARVLYIHDNGQKEIKQIRVEKVWSSDDIPVMFKHLKAEINVPLGCTCVCNAFLMETYTNQFIISALENGFQKAEIIDWDTAKYFDALSNLNIKINRSSIIWICEFKFKIQIWKGSECLEKIRDVPDMQRLESLLKSKQPPNIFIFNDSIFKDVSELIKTIHPQCMIFKLEIQRSNHAQMALIYAEIMAGERKIFIDDDETTIAKDYRNILKTIPNNLHGTSQSHEAKHSVVQGIPHIPRKIIDNTTASQKSERYQTFLFPNKTSSSDDQIDILGIDLGTSRCCAAVNRKNGIETVALDYKGERLLPSYVSYNEKTPIFGQLVIDRLRHYAKYTVFDSKRIIGRNLNEIEIDSNWSFELTEINKKVLIEIKKADDRRGCVSAEEVATDLLKRVKQKSEEFQGTKLNNVVITVPAAFTETQKSATENAGKLAGFTNIHLLPEPIAAAFAYLIDRPIPNNSTVLVFDLGGGTLDVCIFKIENSQLYIISNTGDSKLGGRDFDTVLINYFNNQLGSKYAIKLLHERKYQLMTKCQTIKENLSVLNESFLDIDEVDNTQGGIIPVTRTEFEKMTQNLLNRIRNTINAALLNSNLSADQINKVLQVGGGSRMPMIKRLLQQLFPSSEHICEEHPEEVVAIGAAYYAYSSKSKT